MNDPVPQRSAAAAAPRGPSVLALHAAAVFCLGTAHALVYILPFLARERFGATNWQTTVLTASVPVTQFAAIFWNRLYDRLATGRYLCVIALAACLPIALIGTATNIWIVMGLFFLAALGGAAGVSAMAPLSADLLRTCYDAARHGRVFGVICAAQFLATTIAGQLIGMASDRSPDAFRVYFPAVAGVMGCGLLCVRAISHKPFWRARGRAPATPGGPWHAPLRDMARVLKEDRRFAGYEAAFMSYGIGWMICTALIPAIATDRLKLNYTQFAQATIVAYQITNVVLLAPMGWVADRVGPMRLAAGSFAWLTLYPLALIFVPSAGWLGLFAILYAVGMVGVQLTWTLGPVRLAGDSSKAPQYLAIHSTLVGVRGIVAQGLGMILYALTGSFAWPLVLAAAGFGWASRRMRLLVKEGPDEARVPRVLLGRTGDVIDM